MIRLRAVAAKLTGSAEDIAAVDAVLDGFHPFATPGDAIRLGGQFAPGPWHCRSYEREVARRSKERDE